MNSFQPVPQPRKRRFRIGILIIALIVTAACTVALAGWKDLYQEFLETSRPTITIDDMPRGIGIAPVSLVIQISDSDAGLDEAVVRVRQKAGTKELRRESLGGRKHATFKIDFSGDKSILEEGPATFEIRAFDRSLWSNSGENTFVLNVDYRKPRVEAISTQHNARQGGSQLVFYKAYDEDLSISGVKVGNRTFLGFPAHGLDRDLEDPDLFVAIYGVDLKDDSESVPVRVFAEDGAGNAASASFYNKIQRRGEQRTTVNLSVEYLRQFISPIAEQYFPKVQDELRNEGVELTYKSEKGSDARLAEQYVFVNNDLRKINDREIVKLLKGPRFERYWDGPFQKPFGAIRSWYGVTSTYMLNGNEIDKRQNRGIEMELTRDDAEVKAANDGIIIFSQNIDMYGQAVAIDHGLGLVSIYYNLAQVQVQKGERVVKGQILGTADKGGTNGMPRFYFEIRVHGMTVDPSEWLDFAWYDAHVDGKISDAKVALGIAVYRKIE